MDIAGYRTMLKWEWGRSRVGRKWDEEWERGGSWDEEAAKQSEEIGGEGNG